MIRKPLSVSRALVSVWNKDGIVPFCRSLAGAGVQIVSSGGTAAALTEAGIEVTPVSEVTGFPEILDGRVKTLNPMIHGGILARKDVPAHLDQLEDLAIPLFDLVVVNLYPFEKTAEEGAALADALEMIDIGGPAMVRAAAKNFPSVAVVVNPDRYDAVADELANETGISYATRLNLAREAFAHTCLYDAAIVQHFSGLDEEGNRHPDPGFPETIVFTGTKVQDLRYGENPHQKASFYAAGPSSEPLLTGARQLWGKELSYNNILDTDATLQLILEFTDPACVIIKHTNPCGAAVSGIGLADAYKKAMETDPLSAFGGIVGLNRSVDEHTARELLEGFKEVIIAPAYTPEALELLKTKKNLRLLELPGIMDPDFDPGIPSVRSAGGGYLVQERDLLTLNENTLKVVTDRRPDDDEFRSLRFAWIIGKHVKSNAIVYAGDGQLVGVGAGQMSRVDSAKIGVMKANLPVKGSVLASDAFFPFRDGVDAAADAGVTAIIQPGGSVRDEEVIAAANEHKMAMVFTGIRHFRH